MQRRLILWSVVMVLAIALGIGSVAAWQQIVSGVPNIKPALPRAEFEAAYHSTIAPSRMPMRVYHLGHSLTGRDMPSMLQQRVAGHLYESQLGWGTSLREHWEPHLKINGFSEENDHPRYRLVREALTSADYDAIILTEMSSLEDALKWHATPWYIADIAGLARQMRPDVRIYLYQNWRNLDDPRGWVEQTTADLTAFWENEFLSRAQAHGSGPVYLIPGGAALVAAALAAEAGTVPGLTRREDFFLTLPDGTTDRVHLNPLGSYLIALVHEAVLYHKPPSGGPYRFSRPDGPVFEIAPPLAARLQEIVWEVVSAQPGTGIKK